MNFRSLAAAVAALSSMHVASAHAQSVYVAPGGVYIGAGPVYVMPAPNNPATPYVAPSNGYEYGPPPAVNAPPVVVAPSAVYGPNGGYYNNGNYYNGGYYNGGYHNGGGYYERGGYEGRGYYDEPISAYGAVPRPPAAVGRTGSVRCVVRNGVRMQGCY